MAVKKNSKTGKWQFDGKIYMNGKAIHSYRRSGFNTKKEAVRAEIEYRDNFDTKKYTLPSLQDLIDGFIPFWKTQVKPSTADQEEKVYNPNNSWNGFTDEVRLI